jgi:hypothetical protein
VGVYGGVLAWLQMGRILTPALGVIIAVGLVIIEGLIRMRERSRWIPHEEPEALPADPIRRPPEAG